MRTAILYGSTHGRTARVVNEVARHLHLAADVLNVRAVNSAANLLDYDLLLFFSPTYGDEELQADMEEFVRKCDVDLAGRKFVICELGSYYGYDDFSFGALKILRHHLRKWNGIELCEPLSLDSFPRVPWDHLRDWVDYLNGKINEQRGYCHA